MAVGPAHRILKDKRTKNLVKRLQAGDIAFINHPDLDGTAARSLADCRVCAVVNAAPSITGKYPNRGPGVLLAAGIPLVDSVGEDAFLAAPDQGLGFLSGGTLAYTNGPSCSGTLLNEALVSAMEESARLNLNAELDRFARNTLEYLNNERSLLFDVLDVPRLRTPIADRHVMIVVRGEGYKEDLNSLHAYLSDVRPVMLAVDGGADALLEAKLRPDIILGDMDSVSDAALRCGAELIVHAYARGDERGAPGLERIQQMGLKAHLFHAPGTSEDIAMLLADELGARLIVAVGTHFSLVDFLDKGRAGMASTFLTRLRIGSKLVDARGIGRLWWRQRPRLGEMALIVLAAACPILAVLFLSEAGRNLLRGLGIWLRIHLR